MKNFFKSTLATIVGLIVFNIIAIILFLIVTSVIMLSVSGDKLANIKPNAVLELNLNYPINERTSENILENFDFLTSKLRPTLGLNDILKDIERAKHDSNIKGIYLELGIIQTGIATVEEIREALIDFKKSGKFIVSYADSYPQITYYLASVADSIFVNTTGYVSFTGLKSEVLFYKKALDKLGIEPEIFRHGKFKSYIEPYKNTKMSKENRLQREKFLYSIWDDILQKIDNQRGISPEKLNALADNLTIRSANAAVTNGLIDGMKYKDEIYNILLSLSSYSDKNEPQLIKLSDYHNINIKLNKKKNRADKIAIIYAQGTIKEKGRDEKEIGAESLSQTIRKIRLDSNIKAIVFRINSGGGSALASEVIWRELYLASQAKPLIASMGSAAASGGYYVLASADTIVANSSTITGSIGVFGMLFNAQSFFENKLGITADLAKTNKHAGMGLPFRPLDPVEREAFQSGVDDIYKDFVSRVAEGRHMDTSSVNNIAGGRIWSGLDAKEIGLVDVIGGLNKAIKIAVWKAKLADYDIVEYPKTEGSLSLLLGEVESTIKQHIVEKELGTQYQYYENLKNIMDIQGIQTKIPFEIKVY